MVGFRYRVRMPPPSLDDHHVVRVLPRLVQQAVGGDHVVHDIALADLLRGGGEGQGGGGEAGEYAGGGEGQGNKIGLKEGNAKCVGR